MSSDRERISTDPTQQYRSVVFQQGRVTLASEGNEASDILNEALRADVGDIVGPVGTPDNGYAISYPGTLGPADFTIGKGTMYLGGERLELIENITFFGQKDGEWLDFPDNVPTPASEEVWLLVREQELGAVEDQNLLEVALGGPDTTQRTRFIQRVVRSPAKTPDCASGWSEVLTQWKGRGYDFDSRLMRFVPFARLKVGFTDTQPQPNPCEPASQGGYLGADNQCIRVMVTAFEGTTGAAKIVWAYDNAFHMFKVVVQNDELTLKLSAPPVDAFHWPRAGQAVELLRSAVRLADGSTMAQNLGQIGLLAGDYNADQRTVQLSGAVTDPPFKPGSIDPPVFLRLWQQELDAKIGQAVTLGDSGLQVTLTAEGANAVALGAFWVFAVRPTTPQEVYPHRYLDAPQPPEGPRLWGCPLAILQWVREVATVTDCREPFDNLVELTKHKDGCCQLTVGKKGTYPDLATAFESIVSKGYGSVGLCLLPDPPVHKVNRLIAIHKAPQLRVEIVGSGPMTAVEVSGGGFDVQGIRAFALDKLHVRLMDEKSQFLVTHCESLEVLRTRVDRVRAEQTIPMLNSSSNRNVRVGDSTFDAGYAMFTEFIAALGLKSPLAMPLFSVELLREPLSETVDRLAPVARLSEKELTALLKITETTMIRQGFDKSPYAKAMKQWLKVVSQIEGMRGDKLETLATELLEKVLQVFLTIQSSHPGTGAVFDHVGDNWLASSEFRCSVSFSGTPGKRINAFAAIVKVFKNRINVTANGHVTSLGKCTFDLLTYGDALVQFLAEKHPALDHFYAPTSLVIEGCVFRVSPCFFFGANVLLTNNCFTFNGPSSAWVISQNFCPTANTGVEGPIQYLAQNNADPFQPLNLIGLKAS